MSLPNSTRAGSALGSSSSGARGGSTGTTTFIEVADDSDLEMVSWNAVATTEAESQVQDQWFDALVQSVRDSGVDFDGVAATTQHGEGTHIASSAQSSPSQSLTAGSPQRQTEPDSTNLFDSLQFPDEPNSLLDYLDDAVLHTDEENEDEFEEDEDEDECHGPYAEEAEERKASESSSDHPSGASLIDESLLTNEAIFEALSHMESMLTQLLEEDHNPTQVSNEEESQSQREPLHEQGSQNAAGADDRDQGSMFDDVYSSLVVEEDSGSGTAAPNEPRPLEVYAIDPMPTILTRHLPRCIICGNSLAKDAILHDAASCFTRAQINSTVVFNSCGHLAHAACAVQTLLRKAKAIREAMATGGSLSDAELKESHYASRGEMACPECGMWNKPLTKEQATPFVRVYINWPQVGQRVVDSELAELGTPLSSLATQLLRQLAEQQPGGAKQEDIDLLGQSDSKPCNWALEGDLILLLIEKLRIEQDELGEELIKLKRQLAAINDSTVFLSPRVSVRSSDSAHAADSSANEVKVGNKHNAGSQGSKEGKVTDSPSAPLRDAGDQLRKRNARKAPRKNDVVAGVPTTMFLRGASPSTTGPPGSSPRRRRRIHSSGDANDDDDKGLSPASKRTKSRAKAQQMGVVMMSPVSIMQDKLQKDLAAVGENDLDPDLLAKLQTGEMINIPAARHTYLHAQRKHELTKKELAVAQQEHDDAMIKLHFAWDRLQQRPMTAHAYAFSKELSQLMERQTMTIEQVSKQALSLASNFLASGFSKTARIQTLESTNADEVSETPERKVDIFGEEIKESSPRGSDVEGIVNMRLRSQARAATTTALHRFIVGTIFGQAYALGGSLSQSYSPTATSVDDRELLSPKLDSSGRWSKRRFRHAVGAFLMAMLGRRLILDPSKNADDPLPPREVPEEYKDFHSKFGMVRPVEDIDIFLVRLLSTHTQPHDAQVRTTDDSHLDEQQQQSSTPGERRSSQHLDEKVFAESVLKSSDFKKMRALIQNARQDAQSLAEGAQLLKEMLILDGIDRGELDSRLIDKRDIKYVKDMQMEKEILRKQLNTLRSRLASRKREYEEASQVTNREETQMHAAEKLALRELHSRLKGVTAPNDLVHSLRAALSAYMSRTQECSIWEKPASRASGVNSIAQPILSQQEKQPRDSVAQLGEVRPRPTIIRRIGATPLASSSLHQAQPQSQLPTSSPMLGRPSLGALVAQDIAALKGQRPPSSSSATTGSRWR